MYFSNNKQNKQQQGQNQSQLKRVFPGLMQ